MATRFLMKSNQSWYIRYKDVDGKWKNVSCGKRATAEDAETIRKNYDAKELNRKHKATIRIVKADLCKQLEVFKDTEVPRSNTGRPKGRKSIVRYQAIIKNFLFWIKEKGLSEYDQITDRTIRDFFDSLTTLDRAASTVEKYKQLLSIFWQWSIEQNFCAHNPVLKIPTPKRVKSIPRFFSEEELEKIFAAALDQYRNIYKFLYLTGLRIGELGNLEWTDYLEQSRSIKLRVIEGNKTKREEVVPLSKDAIKILEDQKTWKLKFDSPDSHRYVFTNMAGAKLDNANIYRNLAVICGNNNILDAKPHTFRHTCASHLVMKGVSIYVVRDILRHASVEETEIYAHLAEGATRAAVELLST